MMTDEDKEATIKNGRGLFSDGPLWARARWRGRNGEKGGMGRAKAWEGTQPQGRTYDEKTAGCALSAAPPPALCPPPHEPQAVNRHDAAAPGSEKDRETLLKDGQDRLGSEK